MLETIRGVQARLPLSRRLMWNRARLHVWPVMEVAPEELRRMVARIAPLTEGLGLEMLLIQGRLRESDGVVRERVLRFFAPTGHDVAVELDDPPTRPLRPLDESAQRLISARRRGTLHPAEVVRLLAPAQPGPEQPAGTFVEHELDDDGQLHPGRASARHQSDRDRRRHGAQLHRALPRGDAARDPAGRPDARARSAGRARVPADHRGVRPRRAARRAARVVRAVGGCADLDGQRHRDDGLDRCGAAPRRAVRAGRRRGTTSSSPASTSARSRTATPRRRC